MSTQRSRALVSTTALFLLTACYGGSVATPRNAPSSLARPDMITAVPDRAYVIGPFDKVSVIVLGVEELKRETEVNANGEISMPLIGFVRAAGKTPDQLAAEITTLLSARYLRNPQVTVNVLETKSQLVTVDGAVRDAGVFPVTGRMTLQRAVALAKGTTEDAALQEVAVFRTVDGKRMAAVFSLSKIRAGEQPDPEIFGNDIIVVGSSNVRRIFRDTLTTLPLLALFRPF